jgi:hypothetical protein
MGEAERQVFLPQICGSARVNGQHVRIDSATYAALWTEFDMDKMAEDKFTKVPGRHLIADHIQVKRLPGPKFAFEIRSVETNQLLFIAHLE